MVFSKLSTLSRPPYTSKSRGEFFYASCFFILLSGFEGNEGPRRNRANPLSWGDFTKMNVAEGDMGGELDPHGATGNGNPVGGNVTSNISGEDVHYEEWMK